MGFVIKGGALATAITLALAGPAGAAVTLTGNGMHSNDFNTLAASGELQTGGLAGWEFLELGISGNQFYDTTNGGENTGNTFSLGTTGAVDRAFGGMTHDDPNRVRPLLGVQLVNNTGKLITGFTVEYTGEQWRLGQTNRGADRLDFAYRVGTSQQALNLGGFTDVDALDFVAPNTTGAQIRNGNLAANRRFISGNVGGLKVGRGEVLTLRWSDFNIKGLNGVTEVSDDALGIDDFTFTPVLAAIPEPATWAMMIAGFGMVGGTMRRRRTTLALA